MRGSTISVGLLAVVIALLSVGCGPPSPASTQGAPARKAPAELKAGVFVEHDGFSGSGRELVARFRLVNRTGKEIRYSGYRPDYPRRIGQRREGNNWVQEFHEWCGTGAQMHPLPPGGSLTIAIAVGEDHRPMRLGVFSDAASEQDDYTIWSEVVFIPA